LAKSSEQLANVQVSGLLRHPSLFNITFQHKSMSSKTDTNTPRISLVLTALMAGNECRT